MSQAARNAMSFDGGAHRLGDDQSHPWTRRGIGGVAVPARVDNDVRLHGPYPVPNRRIEFH
jgi:hypothetical protein